MLGEPENQFCPHRRSAQYIRTQKPMSYQFSSAVLLGWACLLNSPAVAADADFQHVWVHYDYMVFPQGWTSAGGTTFPGGLSMAPSREAIDKVVGAFAAQGLILHIDPIHNAI